MPAETRGSSVTATTAALDACAGATALVAELLYAGKDEELLKLLGRTMADFRQSDHQRCITQIRNEFEEGNGVGRRRVLEVVAAQGLKRQAIEEATAPYATTSASASFTPTRTTFPSASSMPIPVFSQMV